MTKKRSLVTLVIFDAVLALGWRLMVFVAQDDCLDRGGSWQASTRSCRGATLH